MPASWLDAWTDVAHGGRCACCERPGRVLCGDCARSLPSTAGQVRPDPAPPGLAPTYTAGWYAAPLRPLLLAHKERRCFGLARPLGGVLAGVIADVLAAVPDLAAQARVVLVPAPSNPGAVRERGHDAVQRMVRVAAGLLRRAGYDAVVAPLVRHRGAVDDQAGLDAARRAENVAGLLGVDPRVHRRVARGRRPAVVVLCDDVITTGATAREAQRALSGVGIEVAFVATLAATRKRGRDPT